MQFDVKCTASVVDYDWGGAACAYFLGGPWLHLPAMTNVLFSANGLHFFELEANDCIEDMAYDQVLSSSITSAQT